MVYAGYLTHTQVKLITTDTLHTRTHSLLQIHNQTHTHLHTCFFKHTRTQLSSDTKPTQTVLNSTDTLLTRKQLTTYSYHMYTPHITES